jgi:hypothetical protein
MRRAALQVARVTLASFAGCAILLTACSVQPARKTEWHEVRDLHYGEVLFDFYQQNYFSAITHLGVAQHFNRVSHHEDEAELLRGGMLLSYGVHLEAGRIFERLAEKGTAPSIRDRAWFYLAKIRYQRGYLAEAEAALAHIQGTLPVELEDERQLLHAMLLMNRMEYAQAAELLARVGNRSEWARYGRYNLGVALIKSGDLERGVALLDAIGRERVRGEEWAALKDKANVALGYAFLQNSQPARAQAYLERVRLDGLMANKALLGMGWAHAALDQHEQALVPWSVLYKRDVHDPAVEESLLAVPYALGKLGAYRQSLAVYQAVITTFQDEMAQLDKSIAAIRGGQLSKTVLRQDRFEEMGWFWHQNHLPEGPEARYLLQLMAGHDFQEAMKNYRDLRFLLNRLDRWSNDIGSYEDMLAARRVAFAERLPHVLSPKRALDLPRLVSDRDRYAAELERIEDESDTVALANEKEQAQLDSLNRIQKQLDGGLGADADARDRVRLLRGLLQWDIASDFTLRLWQAKKSLQDADRLLREAAGRRAALVRAQQDAPREFDDFAQRIRASRARILALRASAQDLLVAQEAHIGALAVATLQQQHERLGAYVTQARFAVAQIYDQSNRRTPETP